MNRLLLLAGLLMLLPSVQAISIDASTPSIDGDTGTTHVFNTTVTNDSNAPTGRLVVSMNIVNLQDDRVVDPEDWSPERSQYIDALAPSESVTLDWTIFAILGGDYGVYFVVIEEPAGPTEAGNTAVSPAVHLIVHEKPQYNPGGILPYTIGLPVATGLLWFGLRTYRKTQLDA